jgi:hypothetical protein
MLCPNPEAIASLLGDCMRRFTNLVHNEIAVNEETIEYRPVDAIMHSTMVAVTNWSLKTDFIHQKSS